MTNASRNSIFLPTLNLETNYNFAIGVVSAFPNTAANVTPLSVTLRTSPARLRALAAFIAKSTVVRATTLVDIAVTDRLGAKGRFSVKYLFLSALYNNRVIVEIYVDETTTVPSLASSFFNRMRIFASAGWLEREVWDLFGIYFTENGDLRRILTDYGFTGHPLRKDFPLTGFHELVYNDAEGRVTAEPVELAQEFRVFHL